MIINSKYLKISGNSDQTNAVVKSGAVPILIRLLQSNSSHLVEQCVWAIGLKILNILNL